MKQKRSLAYLKELIPPLVKKGLIIEEITSNDKKWGSKYSYGVSLIQIHLRMSVIFMASFHLDDSSTIVLAAEILQEILRSLQSR